MRTLTGSSIHSPCSAVGSSDALGSSNNRRPTLGSETEERINVRDLYIKIDQPPQAHRRSEKGDRHTNKGYKSYTASRCICPPLNITLFGESPLIKLRTLPYSTGRPNNVCVPSGRVEYTSRTGRSRYVSNPSGRRSMNSSAPPRRAASRTLSSSGTRSGSPRAMLSLICHFTHQPPVRRQQANENKTHGQREMAVILEQDRHRAP